MHDGGFLGGGGGHNMLKSSVFVPSDWKIKNNAAGIVGLIQGVIRAIDRNIAPERMAPVGHGMLGGHGMHSRHGSHGHSHGHSHGYGGHAGNSHGGHGGHGNPGYSHSHAHSRPGGHTRHGSQGSHRSHRSSVRQDMRQSHPIHGMHASQGGHMNHSVHGHGHGAGGPPRMNNMSRVSIVDDRASIFSRRWDTLPRGSHAMVNESSISTTCPRCKRDIWTVVRRQTGGKNLLATAALAAVGIVANAPATLLPLALTALELNSLKRKVHYCPRCNYKMGKHVTINIPDERKSSSH